MEQKHETKYFKPGEVAKVLDVSTDLLRKYTDHFNIQTERSKEDGTGYRKYTKENIEELREILRLVREENFSWDQVLSWKNGDEEVFVKIEEKSRLEKKIDKLLEKEENQESFNERQEQFNMVLARTLDEVMKELKSTKEQLAASEERNRIMEEKIELLSDPNSDINQLEKKLDEQNERAEARDRLLIESYKQIQEQNKRILEQKPELKRKKRFGLF